MGCGFWAYYLFNTSDIVHSSYEKYNDVEFEKGWIPRWIPKDSFDINETHNIDTNEIFIVFKSRDYEKFLFTCKKLELKNIPAKLAKLNQKTELKDYNFFICKNNDKYIVAYNTKLKKFYIFDR